MGKVRYWYDDATLYAWGFSVAVAAMSGVPCLAGAGTSFCVPSLALAFLTIAFALTVPLVYLIVTFNRRPESPSGELREDARIR
jgi:hypothetical protein